MIVSTKYAQAKNAQTLSLKNLGFFLLKKIINFAKFKTIYFFCKNFKSTKMRKVTQQEFDKAYELHQLWLSDIRKGNPLIFVHCDLSKIKFPKKANLLKANLQDSNLYFVNLENANLRYSNLQNAYLEDVNLKNSDLRYSNLQNAFLQYTDLRNSNLHYAKLRNTYFCETDLRNAVHKNIFSKPKGRACIWVPSDNGIIINAGCFRGTIDEFESQARELYGDKEPNNYAAEIKKLREIENIYKNEKRYIIRLH